MDPVPEKQHNPPIKRVIGVMSGKGIKARVIRWAALSPEAKKDADRAVSEIELAVATLKPVLSVLGA